MEQRANYQAMFRRLKLQAATLVAGLLAAGRIWAAAEVPAPEFAARWWQTEHGLPQNAVNAILQSRDGYLWVGTDDGLARFDGERMTQPHHDDGLAGVQVRSLAQDGG